MKWNLIKLSQLLLQNFKLLWSVTYNWTSDDAVWSIVAELVLLNAMDGCWNWEVDPGNIVNSAGVEKGLLFWAPETPLPNRLPVLDVKEFPALFWAPETPLPNKFPVLDVKEFPVLFWAPEIPLPNRFPVLEEKKFPSIHHNIDGQTGKREDNHSHSTSYRPFAKHIPPLPKELGCAGVVTCGAEGLISYTQITIYTPRVDIKVKIIRIKNKRTIRDLHPIHYSIHCFFNPSTPNKKKQS